MYAADAPTKQEVTLEFFETKRELYNIAISEIVLFEISKTSSEKLQQQLYNVNAKYEIPVLKIEKNEQKEIDIIAENYFKSGDYDAAKQAVQKALDLFAKKNAKFDYMNIAHNANSILGQIAFKKGDYKSAVKHGYAAFDVPSSPVLSSFGPDITLIRLLAQKDECKKDAIKMLELARKLIDKPEFRKLIKSLGGTPKKKL